MRLSSGGLGRGGLAFSAQRLHHLRVNGKIRHLEVVMKSICTILIAALLLVSGCANTQNMSAEELDALRKSNERYERSKGP